MESIIYELKANNIKESDISIIMDRVKSRVSEENIDHELQRLGYDKIFTADYNDYDLYSYGLDDEEN